MFSGAQVVKIYITYAHAHQRAGSDILAFQHFADFAVFTFNQNYADFSRLKDIAAKTLIKYIINSDSLLKKDCCLRSNILTCFYYIFFFYLT